MNETADLHSVLIQILPAIDRCLAEQDVPLAQRPLRASIHFVINFIEKVQEQEAAITNPRPPKEFLKSSWFASLYEQVETWYRNYFPNATQATPDGQLLGIVVVVGTIFAIHVPNLRTRPGNPGKTVWLSFPDGLRDDENVLDWIKNPPNYSMLSPSELCDAEEFATEVTNNLRFIHTGLMGVKGGNDTLDGFKDGILLHLQQAAQLLLDQKPESSKRAYWELQVACEETLKTLQVQQTGKFKETHDLFYLYDEVSAPSPAFNRDLLKTLPRWEEMANLRYGQGTYGDRNECVKCYRATLAIVAGAVNSMEKVDFGSGEIEIARAPWISQS